MNLEEALDRRAANPLRVLAGGTDFYPSLGDKSPPTDVIDTTCIKAVSYTHLTLPTILRV